jgi:UPF0716 protein FxsA
MMLSEKQTARQARRPPIGLILLAALIVVPLAEIAVLIEVGGWLGLGPTLALIIFTAVLGTWLLRRQGVAVLRRAQQQMQQGSVPLAEVFEGACLVIAGALLLTPGFLSDTAGAVLLLPPVRALLYRRVRRRLEEQVRSGAAQARPEDGPYGRDQTSQSSAWQDRGPQGRPPVIDVEFEEVEPGDMPAPRGSWRRRP